LTEVLSKIFESANGNGIAARIRRNLKNDDLHDAFGFKLPPIRNFAGKSDPNLDKVNKNAVNVLDKI